MPMLMDSGTEEYTLSITVLMMLDTNACTAESTSQCQWYRLRSATQPRGLSITSLTRAK
jgi:hypothetical protein